MNYESVIKADNPLGSLDQQQRYVTNPRPHLEPNKKECFEGSEPDEHRLTAEDHTLRMKKSMQCNSAGSGVYEAIQLERDSSALKKPANREEVIQAKSSRKRNDFLRKFCLMLGCSMMFFVGLCSAYLLMKYVEKLLDQSPGKNGTAESRDINECLTNKGGCAHICSNNEGSFTCSCNPGYQLMGDKKGCQDTNECQRNNGGCAQVCTNNEGSITCGCNPGYQLMGDKKSCHDLDECLTNNGGCNSTCVNSLGSFSCGCNPGYQLTESGRECVDINECLINNGACAHVCSNNEGSFTCSCNPGYQLMGDRKSCQVSCRVDLESVGATDVVSKFSYIKINGQYEVRPISWNRGITIVRFDPKTCTAIQVPIRYDTCYNAEEIKAAVSLAAYINSQPAGTVLLGVSGDEAQASLSPALATLKSNGVNADDLQYRGKLTFTMVVGHPNQSSYKILPAGGLSLYDTKRFSENCTVEWRSVGFVDQPEYSSVKINNQLYLDPLQPCSGIYLYVIDIHNCSPVRQASFDTRTDPSAGGRLQTFLQSLPSGTFLAGVTCKSASQYLFPASTTLAAMGVSGSLEVNGKMCFVLQVARPDNTLSKIAGAEGHSLELSSSITERDVSEKQLVIDLM